MLRDDVLFYTCAREPGGLQLLKTHSWLPCFAPAWRDGTVYTPPSPKHHPSGQEEGQCALSTLTVAAAGGEAEASHH